MLVLQGEIDLHESPRVKAGVQRLLEQEPRHVFVDLSRVTFIDSSGLAVLIEAMQRIQAYGGKLALIGIHDAVQSIIHIARLDQVFRIFPDKAAAEAAMER
ncbi:MAG: STAS domain-containing protein [Verrucomicrobia bacterium]|nr:STAS domain-containing protein [Verrucomicrobiota bacterium]